MYFRFSRNDGLLLSCSVAGIIRIWNTRTLMEVNEVMTTGLSFTGMVIHQDYLFLISTEKAVRQYEIRMKDPNRVKFNQIELVRKLDTHPDENVTSIEINKQGDVICIGTNKGPNFITDFF